MTTTKQLSRVAGVPRLKLPIWKAAAAQFFTGQEPSRDDQRNKGKKTKVALLRELAASDPAVRSWLIKFATDMRARDARQIASEQGLTMPEKLGFVPLFPGDRPDLTVLNRMVCCMEQPNAAELLEKLVTLYPDGDPPEVAERQAREWAEFESEMAVREEQRRNQKPSCSNCGQPATRTIKWSDGRDIPWCDNDHRPSHFSAPPDPQSPAAYSEFGKRPLTGEELRNSLPTSRDPEFLKLDSRTQTLILLREAQESAPPLRHPATGARSLKMVGWDYPDDEIK